MEKNQKQGFKRNVTIATEIYKYGQRNENLGKIPFSWWFLFQL